MKIIGNIVDIIKKEIIYGEISFSVNGIKEIVRLGDERKREHYILPGLVNAHMHVESTMLSPAEYARAAVKFGSVASLCDPHEIANVLGVYGIDYMIENGKSVPFKFYFGAPSCVPATKFETSGFVLNAEVIKSLLKSEDIFFLAEMMNYPAVIDDDKESLEKVLAGKHFEKPVDGHAPGLRGEELKKYISAGISTDHECVSMEEAIEKIEAGMIIQIREGSAAKNFRALYKLIDLFPEKVMLCTDDSHPDDLEKGHMDAIVRMSIEAGLDFFNIMDAVVKNPAKHYGLDVGMLQIDDPADFIVIDHPESFRVHQTWINGQQVYDGIKVNLPESKMLIINNFARRQLQAEDIRIDKKYTNMPVIGVIDGELVTERLNIKIAEKDGYLISNTQNDILKMVVACRYDNSPPAVCFVKNTGLKNGALASSIAHDSHNLIAVGVEDQQLLKAMNRLIEMQGGIVACDENESVELKLEIAGLMTNDKLENVARGYQRVEQKAKQMGSVLHAPFMTLSFLSLLVIPEIKLSDKGLFDVSGFRFFDINKP
ncbi:MAG: adenine deaminase [Bacteroidota bacterium]